MDTGVITESMKEKALEFVCKRIRKARIALGRAERKKGAEHEIEGLKNKIEILEYLSDAVLNKEDGRQ